MRELIRLIDRFRLCAVLLMGAGVIRCDQPAPTAGTGGATETTNARTVVGTVYAGNNKPAPRALIRIRPDTYLPGRETGHTTNIYTDSNGYFSFTVSADIGITMEVISSEGLSRLLYGPPGNTDNLRFDSVVVESVSTVLGVLEGGGDLDGTVLGIAGTERTGELTSAGVFMIDSVPVGVVNLAAYRKSVNTFVPVLDSLAISSAGTVALGSVQFPNIDSGLILQWRFDEENGDTVRDVSGNGRHLDIHEAQRQGGIAGNCLFFDGEDDTAAMRDTLMPSLSGTIAFWMKPDVLVPPASDPNDRIRVIYGNSSFEVTISDSLVGNEMLAENNNILKSTTRLSTDRWYHVVCTWDGTSTESAIYLNGRRDAANTTATEEPESARVVLGKRGKGYPLFRGKLDEIRLYDRVLTPEEIRGIFLINDDL